MKAEILESIKTKIEKEQGWHYGFTDWKVDKATERKERNYGKIPNVPEQVQHTQAEDEETTTKIKEPWEFSRPNKRERDRIIWNMREDNATWNDIYSELDKDPKTHAAISTIKENYERMKKIK
jgi:hypothetical protein